MSARARRVGGALAFAGRLLVAFVALQLAHLAMIFTTLGMGALAVLAPVFSQEPQAAGHVVVPLATALAVTLAAYACAGAVGAWAGRRPGTRAPIASVALVTAAVLTALQLVRFWPSVLALTADSLHWVAWRVIDAVGLALPVWLARRYSRPRTMGDQP